MIGFLRRLQRDESGVILPYITVLLVVFIGVGALALDGGRAMSLQTQMQKAADALASAGAAELDRLSTSTGRAYASINSRMNALMENSSLFSGNVAITNIRFLAVLPTTDNMSVTALCSNNSCTAAQSVSARFVEVTVTPIAVPRIMPIGYVNAALGNITTGASAVAGMDQVSCGLTPIFICNPFEQSGDSYDVATGRLETADALPEYKRKLIRLADPGPSGIWGPGDFGYLVPEPGTLPTDSCFPAAGDEIGKAMAMDRPLVCVRQNGVDLLTGNANAAKNGLNTRFGIYASGPLSNASCKSAYPPDKNVRKAWQPQGTDWCQPNKNYGNDSGSTPEWPPGTNNASFGVDSCLLGNNSCSPQANIGASTWDCATYWAAAHPGRDVAGVSAGGRTCSSGQMSRKEVYDYEIANNWQSDTSAPFNETGNPNLACTGTSTGTAGRREMYVAIVNCKALQSTPNPVQSNATNIPVAAFGKFFLTHPTTNQTKPYAEFMGLVERGAGITRDLVQLYR